MSTKRIIAKFAAIPLAASAVAAAAVLTVAPANAAVTRYAAIVYSPATGAWGWAHYARSTDEAGNLAFSYCVQAGGTDCAKSGYQVSAKYIPCISLVRKGSEVATAQGYTEADAEGAALQKLGAGKVLVSTCGGQSENIGIRGRGGVSPLETNTQPYGPKTCKTGYVWREARNGDTVCVTPDVRDRTARENAKPSANKDPNGDYGPESCKQGFVWREAFDGDTICVTPNIRAQTLADNAAEQSRYQSS